MYYLVRLLIPDVNMSSKRSVQRSLSCPRKYSISDLCYKPLLNKALLGSIQWPTKSVAKLFTSFFTFSTVQLLLTVPSDELLRGLLLQIILVLKQTRYIHRPQRRLPCPHKSFFLSYNPFQAVFSHVVVAHR